MSTVDKTHRIFFDASALFAAAYSPTGGSRELIRLALRGEVELVASKYVLEEVRKNLGKKAPELVADYDLLLRLLDLEVVSPTPEEVSTAAKHVEPKDAPIIAAAKKAKVDYLVSFDEKHLLGNSSAAQHAEAKIVTAGDALAAVREE